MDRSVGERSGAQRHVAQHETEGQQALVLPESDWVKKKRGEAGNEGAFKAYHLVSGGQVKACPHFLRLSLIKWDERS